MLSLLFFDITSYADSTSPSTRDKMNAISGLCLEDSASFLGSSIYDRAKVLIKFNLTQRLLSCYQDEFQTLLQEHQSDLSQLLSLRTITHLVETIKAITRKSRRSEQLSAIQVRNKKLVREIESDVEGFLATKAEDYLVNIKHFKTLSSQAQKEIPRHVEHIKSVVVKAKHKVKDLDVNAKLPSGHMREFTSEINITLLQMSEFYFILQKQFGEKIAAELFGNAYAVMIIHTVLYKRIDHYTVDHFQTLLSNYEVVIHYFQGFSVDFPKYLAQKKQELIAQYICKMKEVCEKCRIIKRNVCERSK